MNKCFYTLLLFLPFFTACTDTSKHESFSTALIQKLEVTETPFTVSASTLRSYSSSTHIYDFPTNAAVLLAFTQDVNESSLLHGITLYKPMSYYNSSENTYTTYLDPVTIEAPQTYKDLKNVRVNKLDYFEAETEYLLVVTSEVMSADGKHLDQNTSFSFTTALHADLTPPSIKSMSPLDGSGMRVDGSVTITFDEIIYPSGDLILESMAGTPITSSTEYGNRSITITPDVSLNPNGQFRARLISDITDLSGNVLTYNALSEFNTTFLADFALSSGNWVPTDVLDLNTGPYSKLETFELDDRDLFYNATELNSSSNIFKIGLNIQNYSPGNGLGFLGSFVPFKTVSNFDYNSSEHRDIVEGSVITKIVVASDILYVATKTQGLYLVDISDKNNSYLMQNVLVDDLIMDMAYDSNNSVLYVATANNGVMEYNVVNAGTLTYKQTVALSPAYGLAVLGNRIYVAMGEKGLAYYEGSTVLQSGIDTYAFAHKIIVYNDDQTSQLMVADAQAGTIEYDVDLNRIFSKKSLYYASSLLRFDGPNGEMIAIVDNAKGVRIYDGYGGDAQIQLSSSNKVAIDVKHQGLISDPVYPIEETFIFVLNETNNIEIIKNAN